MVRITQFSRSLRIYRLHCFAKRLAAGVSIVVVAVMPLPATSEQTLVLNDITGTPYTNASRSGFLDIIVTEAFKRVGLGLKLVRIPAERGLLNANAGIDDGELTRIAGLEKNYPNLIRVPENLIDMSFVAFTKDPRITIAGWHDLESYTVAYFKGAKLLEDNVPDGTHVTLANRPEQLFTMLEKDRVQIVLYELAMGLEIVSQRRMDDVRVITPMLVTMPLFIYLHKKHRHLVPAIARALTDIKAEDLYEHAYQKIVLPRPGSE